MWLWAPPAPRPARIRSAAARGRRGACRRKCAGVGARMRSLASIRAWKRRGRIRAVDCISVLLGRGLQNRLQCARESVLLGAGLLRIARPMGRDNWMKPGGLGCVFSPVTPSPLAGEGAGAGDDGVGVMARRSSVTLLQWDLDVAVGVGAPLTRPGARKRRGEVFSGGVSAPVD